MNKYDYHIVLALFTIISLIFFGIITYFNTDNIITYNKDDVKSWIMIETTKEITIKLRK